MTSAQLIRRSWMARLSASAESAVGSLAVAGWSDMVRRILGLGVWSFCLPARDKAMLRRNGA